MSLSLMVFAKRLFTVSRAVGLGMPEDAESRDPIEFFGDWFKSAEKLKFFLPEAATLATVGDGGKPSARMVLLKDYDASGFTFYTNYGSRKAREIEANPHAAMVFHWNILERQVRLEGIVSRVSEAQSQAYFTSRPRGSQIGAWASRQSSALGSVDELRQRVTKYTDKFADAPVPLPEFWGGYRLYPERIEFWQGRLNRLHDRVLFERDGERWRSRRLYP